MLDYNIKRHIEIDEQYQGVNITEFFYSDTSNYSNQDIINNFLHSNHIENDCIRNYIKINTKKDQFLKGAFELTELFENDFTKSSKVEVEQFLFGVLSEPDWHEDIEDFRKILTRFINFLNELDANDFYIISKDWFEDSKSKKIRPESWVYTYYFIILWIDDKTKTIGYSEWEYD